DLIGFLGHALASHRRNPFPECWFCLDEQSRSLVAKRYPRVRFMFDRRQQQSSLKGRKYPENSRSAGNPGGTLIVEQVFAEFEPTVHERGSDGAGDKQPGISFAAQAAGGIRAIRHWRGPDAAGVLPNRPLRSPLPGG